jgi:hypothetical protein
MDFRPAFYVPKQSFWDLITLGCAVTGQKHASSLLRAGQDIGPKPGLVFSRAMVRTQVRATVIRERNQSWFFISMSAIGQIADG